MESNERPMRCHRCKGFNLAQYSVNAMFKTYCRDCRRMVWRDPNANILKQINEDIDKIFGTK